jgi:hypothetical protein
VITHLHHAYKQGPKLLRGLRIGIALCSARVPRSELSAFVEDCDCPACLECANAPKPKDRERPTLNRDAKWR